MEVSSPPVGTFSSASDITDETNHNSKPHWSAPPLPRRSVHADRGAGLLVLLAAAKRADVDQRRREAAQPAGGDPAVMRVAALADALTW
jgi:hypothetical protein